MVPVKTIGLMSGTSFGVDAALLETDGIRLSRTGPSIYRPYSGPERVLLRQALADRRARPGSSPKPNRGHEGARGDRRTACSRRSALIAPQSRALDLMVRPCCIGPFGADRPDWRRTGAGTPAGGVRFPGCRRGCRRASATGAYIPQAHSIGRARSQFSTSAASPTSPMSIRTYVDQNDDLVAFDTGPGNARASPGMRTALRPNLERPIARSSGRFGTIRFSPNPRPNRSTATPLRASTYRHDGRRGGRDADHADRGDHRGIARPLAASASQLDRCRRGSSQSNTYGDARAAACAYPGGAGRCAWLVRGCP